MLETNIAKQQSSFRFKDLRSVSVVVVNYMTNASQLLYLTESRCQIIFFICRGRRVQEGEVHWTEVYHSNPNASMIPDLRTDMYIWMCNTRQQ